MFELQCMEYIKELEQNSQNSSIRNSLKDLISKNPSKVESFIIQFNLNPQQKQLLLELMQESTQEQNPESSGQNQNSNDVYASISQQSPNNSSNLTLIDNQTLDENSGFYQETMKYFTSWRNEYFKLGSVSPQCVEVAEIYILKNLYKNNFLDKELFELFISLPEQNNEMFKKFKNNVINILISNFIELINKEITIVKTSPISWINKFQLLYKFENLHKKVAKRNLDISKFKKLQQESLNVRNIE